MPGANAFGAALVGADSTPFSELLVNIEQGEVKALILVESDPLNGYPDQRRVREALKRLELLVVVDYLPNRALDLAHVVLPSRSVFETPGCFINQKGRLRVAAAAHRGGLPMEQSSRGHHPPLDFHREAPGSGARAAWQILAELEATVAPYFRVTSFRRLWSQIATELGIPLGEGAGWGGADDQRVGFRPTDVQPFAVLPTDAGVEQDMDELDLILLRVDWLHGTEELSAYKASDRTDVTAFGDSNKTYVQGLHDASGTYSGFFDNATAQTYTAANDGDARRFYLYPDATVGTAGPYFFGTAFFDWNTAGSSDGAVTLSGTWAAASEIAKIP